MQKTSWKLQDAKAQFSAVVDAALNGEAQLVTRRGKRAVVVLDAAEYDRLRRGEQLEAPGFIEHLLAMPKCGARPAEVQRAAITLRDVGFE
jgi:prevent-host-death family protein